MTKKDWETHVKVWCEGCRYYKNGRCPAANQMRINPEDEATNHLFSRLGHCSQYAQSDRA